MIFTFTLSGTGFLPIGSMPVPSISNVLHVRCLTFVLLLFLTLKTIRKVSPYPIVLVEENKIFGFGLICRWRNEIFRYLYIILYRRYTLYISTKIIETYWAFLNLLSLLYERRRKKTYKCRRATDQVIIFIWNTQTVFEKLIYGFMELCNEFWP